MTSNASESAINEDEVFVLSTTETRYPHRTHSIAATSPPNNVVRVRTDPSVTILPHGIFNESSKLEVVELNEGLKEIGRRAFAECKSLKRITIPATVSIIYDGAFRGCRQLKEVVIHNRCRLREIRMDAFVGCESLKYINIPCSIRKIGRGAFSRVPLQNNMLYFPDGMKNLGQGSFTKLYFSKVRIPHSMPKIHEMTMEACPTMFSLELPENDGLQIMKSGFNRCSSLRNVTIPINAGITGDTIFEGSKVRGLFDSHTQMVTALKHRFDHLPVHKMLYYQSYQPVTLDQLTAATNKMGKLDSTGNQQDCLGMTALHVMACSTVQDLALYQELVEKYPETLIAEDKWGAIPLLYSVWGDAPSGVITFLGEKYHSLYQNHDFNWTEMMQTLNYAAVVPKKIHSLVGVQQKVSPDQCIDWDTVLETRLKAGMYCNDPRTELFRNMVHCSVSKRVDAIGLKRWRTDIIDDINTRPWLSSYLANIKAKVKLYETEYNRLKEGTSMLELVLWKKSIDNRQECQEKKKRKEDASDIRSKCRIKCGADIIIGHVLKFLLPVADKNISGVTSKANCL